MSLKIDISFPGGNVFIEDINGFEVTLTKDLRNTEGNWFYWAFRGTFDAPGTYYFSFTNGIAVGTRGPAVSYDDGVTWDWLGAESMIGEGHDKFCYTFDGKRGSRVIFSQNLPYNQIHLDQFMIRHTGSPYLSRSLLAFTRKGREVVKLHVEAPAGPSDRKRIFLSARHHACESMADYGLEGMLEAALGEDELGRELRRRYIIDAVPFVDMDGVVDGDQGKNRRPHDHARDYGERPLYPEVAAIQEFLLETKPFFTLDMHCPWLYSGCNEMIYFPGPSDKKYEAEMLKFSALLEEEAPPEAPHKVSQNILFGTGWNTDANYTQGMTMTRWFQTQNIAQFASAIEISYANAEAITLYPDSVRKLGRALCRCILRYDEDVKKA